jgi:hypothetical protein
LTPQDFSPFAVPAPQFHFVGKPLFAEGESNVWDIAKLKDRLLVIANWYLTCSEGMQVGPWYEQRYAHGTREANLSDFIQTYQAVSDSDRFRSIVLARYGSDLCFNVLNRLIADLVKESDGALTIGGAEKMTLGEAVERLEKPRRATTSGPIGEPECGPRVVLRRLGERPVVGGVEKGRLTLPQYDVVKALLDAGERGLSKDDLDRKSKHGDARKILKRLAESDPDWKAVISFPDKPGGGYRIR